MCDVRVSPVFTRMSSYRFGITAMQALVAVQNHDAMEAFVLPDAEIRLHSKVLDWQGLKGVLLVVESIRGGQRTLELGLRAHPPVWSGCEDSPPLEVLRAIADRFGVDVTVGDQTADHHLRSRVPRSASRRRGILRSAVDVRSVPGRTVPVLPSPQAPCQPGRRTSFAWDGGGNPGCAP